METRVVRARINDIRKTHLGNSTEPLEVFVLHQIKNQRARHGNKTIDGIVYNFMLWKGFQTLTLN